MLRECIRLIITIVFFIMAMTCIIIVGLEHPNTNYITLIVEHWPCFVLSSVFAIAGILVFPQDYNDH